MLKPRSGARVKRMAQAMNKTWEMNKPRRAKDKFSQRRGGSGKEWDSHELFNEFTGHELRLERRFRAA